jgi:ornithine carbamoyltransferase
MDLKGRNFLKEIDFTAGEFLGLIDLSEKMRIEKHIGQRLP